MISDKAVEAAARALARGHAEHLLKSGAMDYQGSRSEAIGNYVEDNWPLFETPAQAALQAALPVLLEGKAEEIARAIDPLPWSDDWMNHPKLRETRKTESLAKANRIISILTGESE